MQKKESEKSILFLPRYFVPDSLHFYLFRILVDSICARIKVYFYARYELISEYIHKHQFPLKSTTFYILFYFLSLSISRQKEISFSMLSIVFRFIAQRAPCTQLQVYFQVALSIPSKIGCFFRIFLSLLLPFFSNRILMFTFALNPEIFGFVSLFVLVVFHSIRI